MRKSLLESFDKIYILDLHGNSKKKEVSPDGSKDENVFDIMQGVSINLFVKTTDKRDLAEVYHSDCYGKRQAKYSFLQESFLPSILWKKVRYKEPYYFFVPKNFSLQDEYDKYLSFSQIFSYSNSGLQTKKDSIAIHFTNNSLNSVLSDLKQISVGDFKIKYKVSDNSSWSVQEARNDVLNNKGCGFTV